MSDRAGSIDRRRFVGGVGVAMVVSAAGCASFDGPRTETGRSARVVVVLDNPGATERAYEVEIDWGGNNRSLFSGTLQPAESGSEMIATTGTAPESATFLIDAAGDERRGTWSPTECPDYRIEAVLGDGTPSVDTTCRA